MASVWMCYITVHDPQNNYAIWNKEELPYWWEESMILPVYKQGDNDDLLIFLVYHCYQLYT
jgi:hypothetical protein